MRTLIITLALLSALTAFAGPKKFNISIEGMTCGACVAAVTDALSKIPDVDPTTVRVVLKKKNATLEVKDEKPETVAQIKKAVAGAGYKVTHISTVTRPIKPH